MPYQDGHHLFYSFLHLPLRDNAPKHCSHRLAKARMVESIQLWVQISLQHPIIC